MAVRGAPRRRSGYQGDGASIRRALRLLEVVSRHAPEPVHLRTVAAETEMNTTTAFRLLNVLVEEGMLAFQPDLKAYALGPTLAVIGARQLGRDPLRSQARGPMMDLWERTGETVTLTVRQGWERVYVDQLVSRHPIRFEVELGTRHPLYAGGTGRAILAFLPPEELRHYLEAPRTPLTAHTVTDRAELERLLAVVRARGFAVSHGERVEGAISVAAPILDARGLPIGALSVCAPDNRVSVNSLSQDAGPLVREGAFLISQRLGYVSPT